MSSNTISVDKGGYDTTSLLPDRKSLGLPLSLSAQGVLPCCFSLEHVDSAGKSLGSSLGLWDTTPAGVEEAH